MSKTKARVLLIILLVLIVVLGVFTFMPFKMNEAYDYNSILGGIKLGVDLKGGVYVVLEADVQRDKDGNLVNADGEPLTAEEVKEFNKNLDGSIAILEQRLFSKGYTESVIVNQGGNKIRVEIPDVDNTEQVFDILGKQAYLEFLIEDSSAEGGFKPITNASGDKLTGANIKKARVGYDADGKYGVSLEFDKDGTKMFADATSNNIGKTIRITVDGEKVSDANIKVGITDGKAIISGDFSLDEANNLAIQIQSGALPLTFKTSESKTMSASLGENTIKTSLIAGLVGIALVMIFMGVFYRGFGLIANIGLIVYILLNLLFLCILPWVQLSLAGIAGVLLSIGMAVDANIIIVERIKDEFRSGKTLQLSVKNGFRSSIGAIVDGNVTTLIAAIVLWIFGTGSIKGFGVTLFIGILVSMFSALLVSRFVTKLFLPLTSNEKFYGLKREVVENEIN